MIAYIASKLIVLDCRERGLWHVLAKLERNREVPEFRASPWCGRPYGLFAKRRDGTVLMEGVAIAQYGADCAPAKKLAPPKGTLARVQLQSWLNFISSEMQLGCFCPIFDREVPEAVKAIFRRRLGSRLAHVERNLAENVHRLGNDFTIGDVYLFVVSNWARPAKLDLSPYPRLLTLRKRVGARPAVQEVMRLENLIS
jgi:glutathione S-transferase